MGWWKTPNELFMLLQWYPWGFYHHQVGVNRRLRLKFRWISRRPGFRDDGNVRSFRSMPRVFGTQPPTLEGDAWTVSFWMSFCSSIMLMLDVFFSSSLHADTFWVCWATLIFLQETGSWSRFSNDAMRYPPWKLTYPYSIHIPWKSIIGRCMSYWNSPFSGDVNFWRGKAAVFDFYWNVDWTKTTSLGNSMHWVNLDQLFVVIQDSIAVKDSFCAADQKGATLRHLCGDWWTGECLEGRWNG